MFCPNCGLETREALKFCKQCGTNLGRVQGVLGKGGAGVRTKGPADWNKVALEEYQEERERKKKKTPEEKRLDEIKTGVITTSIGLGLMIFLRFLFLAIASTLPWQEANVLRGLWWVGWIPFLVGRGVIFNGVVIGKKAVELKRKQESDKLHPIYFSVPNTSPVPQLAESSQSEIADYSVTESTTTKLREPVAVHSSRETN
jgi:hypothetical protein